MRSRALVGCLSSLGLAVALLLGSLVARAPVAYAETPAAPVKSAAAGAPIKIRDAVLFTLEHDYGGRRPSARARDAIDAILAAIDAEKPPKVQVEQRGSALAIVAGDRVVVELHEADARGAPLATVADTLANDIREVIERERQRSAIAGIVRSLSLVVFFGLVAMYVSRRIGELADKARAWMIEHPGAIPGIRLQSFEVVGPVAMRAGVHVLLVVGGLTMQLGTAYVWLIFSLSLFDATQPYTEKLAGYVVTPLSQLAGRLAASLPLAVMALITGAILYVLLRFVRLFFASVARGETRAGSLPPDLARATSVLLSAALVIAALVFAAPLMTGDPDGVLSRIGGVVLLSVGLAFAPLFANGLLGAVYVFGRRLRVGQWLEVASHAGRVRELTLLDLRLVRPDGGEARVPYLACLVYPLCVRDEEPRVRVEISVAPNVSLARVSEVLFDSAQRVGGSPGVQLTHLDAEGACFVVEVSAPSGDKSSSALRMALAAGLEQAGLALGRAAPRLVHVP